MSRRITRSGRQRATLAADAQEVADLLADPVAVTALLGDLLDQERSAAGPPTRWALPRISVGPAHFDTVLLPTFERRDHEVRIEAVTTAESDTAATVQLVLDPRPAGPDACRLVTAWRLELDVPLPRAATVLATPAIDRTVASTVQTIMRRTEDATGGA